MSRILTFLYGTASYLVFLGTFLYSIGFIGDFGVPKAMDSPGAADWTSALLIDACLLSLFAVQHSVMARPWFKRLLTKVVPVAIERSTYVLASSLALIAMYWKWQPLGGVVWETAGILSALIYGVYAFGWTLVLFATCVINHFDLFGLRQVWRNLQRKPQAALQFTTPWLYRVVRHPLYVGWLLVFWSAPTMTMTHLFFASMTTAYILVAIQFEERDLIATHPEYAEYRKQVPMIVPGLPQAVEVRSTAVMGGR